MREGSRSGEKLSLSCQCPQSKTLGNIIPCIPKFTSGVEAGFEKCGFSSFTEEHLFFMAEGLSRASYLRKSLKNMVPCLSKYVLRNYRLVSDEGHDYAL